MQYKISQEVRKSHLNSLFPIWIYSVISSKSCSGSYPSFSTDHKVLWGTFISSDSNKCAQFFVQNDRTRTK